MAIGDPSGSVDLINNLDTSNPLFVQSNDNSSVSIVNFELVGAENNKMWVTAIKIALKGKNKVGFIDGTCFKQESSVVLSQQYERCNAIMLGDLSVLDYYHKLNSLWREFNILIACVCEVKVACTCDAKTGSAKHTQLIRLMQFLMGLNDVYQPIRITILAKDYLPNVKDAFYIVSREESYMSLHSSVSSNKKSQSAALFSRPINYGLIGHTVDMCYELIGYPAGFKRYSNMSKQSGNTKRFNGNSEVNQFVPSTSSSLASSITSEQIMKLLCLINEKPSPSANMSGIKPNFYNNNNNVIFNMHFEKFFCAKSESIMYNVTLGWIIDSGANQHMTDSTKDMLNIVYISNLMLTVGHPNGTLAKITVIGILKLTSGIVLFDVLVVPKYNVSLLSVNKMIKDSQFFVGFDEHKSYIQDLKLGKIMRTGSETGGLYLFDVNKNDKFNAGMSNSIFICYVSSELWHCRLGHPANQVLFILGKQLGFSKSDHISPYDICHKAKHTREPFPLSDHKSKSVGDIIHFEDEAGTIATQIGENVTSEGNVHNN
ncbi:ribonuclease H-like domain-containing protein [Tanacetum coccineum]